MAKTPTPSKVSLMVDMDNVKIIVDVITRALGTLPQMGCNWNLAEYSVAQTYIAHKIYEMTDVEGKIKKAT
jgi:hypothetical protein